MSAQSPESTTPLEGTSSQGKRVSGRAAVPPAVGEEPGQLGRKGARQMSVAHRLVRRHLVAAVAGVGDDERRLLDEDALHFVPVGGGRQAAHQAGGILGPLDRLAVFESADDDR